VVAVALAGCGSAARACITPLPLTLQSIPSRVVATVSAQIPPAPRHSTTLTPHQRQVPLRMALLAALATAVPHLAIASHGLSHQPTLSPTFTQAPSGMPTMTPTSPTASPTTSQPTSAPTICINESTPVCASFDLPRECCLGWNGTAFIRGAGAILIQQCAGCCGHQCLANGGFMSPTVAPTVSPTSSPTTSPPTPAPVFVTLGLTFPGDLHAMTGTEREELGTGVQVAMRRRSLGAIDVSDVTVTLSSGSIQATVVFTPNVTVSTATALRANIVASRLNISVGFQFYISTNVTALEITEVDLNKTPAKSDKTTRESLILGGILLGSGIGLLLAIHITLKCKHWRARRALAKVDPTELLLTRPSQPLNWTDNIIRSSVSSLAEIPDGGGGGGDGGGGDGLHLQAPDTPSDGRIRLVLPPLGSPGPSAAPKQLQPDGRFLAISDTTLRQDTFSAFANDSGDIELERPGGALKGIPVEEEPASFPVVSGARPGDGASSSDDTIARSS